MMLQKTKQRLRWLGNKNPMYGIHRFGKDNPNYGHRHPGLNKGQKRNSMIGKNNPMISIYVKNKHLQSVHKKNYRENQRQSSIKVWSDEKLRKRQSLLMKEKWSNNNYLKATLKKIFHSLNLKPNNPEKIVINLIQQNNLNFIYVGNGKEWIERFNPDFVNKEKKLIIEIFGDYFHNLPNYKVRDKERLITYKKLGYKTLVIWERELKDIKQVENKIKEFIRNG